MKILQCRENLTSKMLWVFAFKEKNGYEIAIISGEKNSAIETMARKFNISEIHQGIRIKIDILKVYC